MPVVTVNHQPEEIKENTTLSTLITQLDIPVNGIAIAVNNSVIAKNDWENISLKNDDTITIIKATQGG